EQGPRVSRFRRFPHRRFFWEEPLAVGYWIGRPRFDDALREPGPGTVLPFELRHFFSIAVQLTTTVMGDAPVSMAMLTRNRGPSRLGTSCVRLAVTPVGTRVWNNGLGMPNDGPTPTGTAMSFRPSER